MTRKELALVSYKSSIWTGPNTWGWVDGYRLDLQEVIKNPGFG